MFLCHLKEIITRKKSEHFIYLLASEWYVLGTWRTLLSGNIVEAWSFLGKNLKIKTTTTSSKVLGP